MNAAEKLILTMLCDLHDKLEVKGRVDAELVSTAVADDALWVVDWAHESLGLNADVPDHVLLVLDVLDMFFHLEQDYYELSEMQRGLVISVHPNAAKLVKYQGFDGNNESEYKAAANYLVNVLGRYEYPHAGKGNKDSHGPMLIKYQGMLAAFKDARNDNGHNDLLTAEQLIEVLSQCSRPVA